MTEIGGNDLFASAAVNHVGAITGTYFDEGFMSHGFLRAPNGTLITFDAPGAVYGTNAEAINALGLITGYYLDSTAALHGFLRTPQGRIMSFRCPRGGFRHAAVKPQRQRRHHRTGL